ncbi:hypothetical protein A20C1_04736 [marine actinobacterium PHSC20C1]|nr:hypothetical protein A20C1_04736 [marine actinobacterium PHSC20C1]
MRIRSWALAVGIIVGAAVALVAILTWLSGKFGESLLPAVQTTAALSLIVVTLIYTHATRELVKNQRHEQQGAALDQIREACMDIGRSIPRVDSAVAWLMDAEGTDQMRSLAIDRIREGEDAATTFNDRIF